MRILDRLIDTPAEVVSELGETLHQTEDRDALGRLWAANLRRVVGERGPDSRAA